MFLRRLKDHEIEIGLKDLVQQERELLHSILLHIQQIEARRIYLDRGYPTLFQYLVTEHSYSASAAARRIDAARLLSEIPELAQPIESGALNLSQIGEVSRGIKEKQKTLGCAMETDQKQELIERVLGQSVRDTQKIIAETLEIEIKASEKVIFQKDGSVHIGLTLTAAQYEKLSKGKDLFAAALQQQKLETSLANVIEFAIDKASRTSKAGPVKSGSESKTKEPNSKPIKSNPASNVDESMSSSTPLPTSVLKRATKTLSPKIRKFVLQRDGCCQYLDPQSMRRCQSTYQLEVDHIQPRRADGGDHLENLQVLCRQHNQSRYRKQSGVRTI